MGTHPMSDDRIYEFAIGMRQHSEERREDINKYYTSLFTAIISIMPFIERVSGKTGTQLDRFNTVPLLLLFLSVIVLTLAFSWVLTLRRICWNLEAIDRFLIDLEKKNDRLLVSFIQEYLSKVDAPRMVTKNEMIVPYVFITIFSTIMVYSVIILVW